MKFSQEFLVVINIIVAFMLLLQVVLHLTVIRAKKKYNDIDNNDEAGNKENNGGCHSNKKDCDGGLSLHLPISCTWMREFIPWHILSFLYICE